MRRREFIKLFSNTVVAWPLTARAQQAAMPVIGFLHIGSRDALGHLVTAFRRGLTENDFVEGHNVAVEYRWGDGQLGRMPSMLDDLVNCHNLAGSTGSQERKRDNTPPLLDL